MAILTLNDDDPSIVYTGTWGRGGTMGMGDTWGSTTYASSEDENTFATLDFTGSGIAVFGTVIQGEQPSSSYEIVTPGSGNKTTHFKLFYTTDKYYFNYTFFQSGLLSSTSQHTLVITPLNGTLFIDYLEIEQNTPFSPVSSPTLQSSTSEFPTTSSSSTSTQQSPTISSSSPSPLSSLPSPLFSLSMPLSSSTQQSSSLAPDAGATAGTATPTQVKSGVAIGAIIGGILGALTLICIFVLALLYLRRRRREDRLGENKGAPPPAVWASTYTQRHPSIVPYDTSLPHPQHSKVQLLVGTQMGAVTTEGIPGGVSTIPVQHSPPPEQTPAVATIPQSSGNVINSSTIVSQSALRDVPESFPSSGNNGHDPPPEYQG